MKSPGHSIIRGDMTAIWIRESGREANGRITRGWCKKMRNDRWQSGTGLIFYRETQFTFGFSFWLLRNSDFFKVKKSACYSRCHEYIVSLWSQSHENVHIYNVAISNHRTVVTRLNKVRFLGWPPTFLGKKSALIIFLIAWNQTHRIKPVETNLYVSYRITRHSNLQWAVMEGWTHRVFGKAWRDQDSFPRTPDNPISDILWIALSEHFVNSRSWCAIRKTTIQFCDMWPESPDNDRIAKCELKLSPSRKKFQSEQETNARVEASGDSSFSPTSRIEKAENLSVFSPPVEVLCCRTIVARWTRISSAFSAKHLRLMQLCLFSQMLNHPPVCLDSLTSIFVNSHHLFKGCVDLINLA
jgi:hypothetical protein